MNIKKLLSLSIIILLCPSLYAGKGKTYAEAAKNAEEKQEEATTVPQIPVINPFKTPEEQSLPATTSTKSTIVAPVIEQEPWFLSKVYGYFQDKTDIGLHLAQQLEKAEKEGKVTEFLKNIKVVSAAHQIERAVYDTLQKEISVEELNKQANASDRLLAILRTNEIHQKNLKKILNAAVIGDLQINDTVLTSAFNICEERTKECVECFKAVSQELGTWLTLNQEIQKLAIAKSIQKKLAINKSEYEYFQCLIKELEQYK